MKIASALVAAQKAFGPALKSATNPHFKSRYADLAACVEAVMEGLNANGIFLMQKTHEDQSGVTVETIFIHESGEQMSAGLLHVPAVKMDAQAFGSALTYARRYSLMAACGIAPEDDDGNRAVEGSRSEKPAPWSIGHEALLANYREAAMQGLDALKAFHATVPQSEFKSAVWQKHGESLKVAAGEADATGV